MPSASLKRAHTLIGLVLAISLFGVPLFLHLDSRDMHNDEASYSYAVERILETGDWLVIRGAPLDGEFLEKPPLKFWLLAGAIKAGLLPSSDIGMRWIDALFGAAAFGYVYLLGCRLHGPVAGLAAGLVLFSFTPLLFEHGLRSNNMEGPVVLAYCAGAFHFVAWVQAHRAARGHAFAAGAAFFLGFMTKFAVMVFLPAVALLVLAMHPDRATVVRHRLREWLWPAVVTTALAAPWFVYETWRLGMEFWGNIFGRQLVDRFTIGIDASHLEPAGFYLTRIREVLTDSRSQWLVAAGLGFVALRALKPQEWPARFVLLWLLVPLAILSSSSSKIIHYVYPFVPPLALAAGWLVGHVATKVAALLIPSEGRRPLFLIVGGLATAVFVYTLFAGRLSLEIAGVQVFWNDSLLRPLLVATGFFWLATGQFRALLVAPVIALLCVPLPVHAYARQLDRAAAIYHPLRALEECLKGEPARTGAALLDQTYLPSGYPPTHAYFYYLRKFGPYVEGRDGVHHEIDERVSRPAPQSLLVFADRDYREWRRRQPALSAQHHAIQAEDDFIVVLPGVTASCMGPAVNSGARPINPPPVEKAK